MSVYCGCESVCGGFLTVLRFNFFYLNHPKLKPQIQKRCVGEREGYKPF